MKPRLLAVVWMVGVLSSAGCNSPLIRSQSPELNDLGDYTENREESVGFVGDRTVPTGLNYLKIEGVALVNGLENTGSDPPPSGLRNTLIGDMQSRKIQDPEDVLAAKTNALVVVRAYLPPGVQKGDRFDLEVVVPPRSDATSLLGGYLFECRLREMRVLDNAVRSGHIAGLAQGSVCVDSIFEGSDDEMLELRGRVLGGGQSQISRTLGLAIRGESTVRQSAMIGAAINSRFCRMSQSGKTGVATPKSDNYVEIVLDPRYKHNITRYIRVLQNIALRETPGERVVRIESLERRLMEPTAAARAALELEAIGKDAAHVLLRGLKSNDPEVRFYSAEALAYLDHEEAAEVLGWAAREEPAFRWHALTALAAMDHVAAYEQLTELLHVPSGETRYGAFRALRIRNAADPLVMGESLGGGFAYHVISSDGPKMVHFSKTLRPEVVLFGQRHRIEPPAFLYAGKHIMIKGLADGQIRLTRFAVGSDEDQQIICEPDVDQLIRAIVQLGGGYGDVMRALQDAKKGGYLESRVVVDAVARPRKFERDEASPYRAANPIPEMFSSGLDKPERERDDSPDTPPAEPDPDEKDEPKGSFMGRIKDRFSR